MKPYDENDDVDWSGADAAASVGQSAPSMDDALERAHQNGGKDTFGVVASLDKPDHIQDAVAQLSKDDGPSYGPVEPPPSEPPSVAPPPEPPPDFKAYPSPKQDDNSASRLSALASIKQLLSAGPPQLPSSLSDDAIQEARGRDEQAQARSDFSRALMALGARKPFESEPVKSEADSLMGQRDKAQAAAGQDQQRKVQGAEAIARLSEKPPDTGLEALRLAEADKWRADDERARAAAGDKATAAKKATDEEAASIEGERAAILADPRAKAVGLTPDMVKNADRKGLAEIRSRMDSYHPPKPAKAGGGPGGGKRLPASSLKELADLDAADEQLAKLEEEGNRLDIGSLKNRAVSMLPETLKANTDIGRYEDSARAAMQGVGTILEHGKLAAGDELKYKRLLPEAGDDKATLHHKVVGLRAFLKQLKAKHSGAYEGGGYSVPGGTVKMKFPDGSVHPVSRDKLDKAKRKGGVEVTDEGDDG